LRNTAENKGINEDKSWWPKARLWEDPYCGPSFYVEKGWLNPVNKREEACF